MDWFYFVFVGLYCIMIMWLLLGWQKTILKKPSLDILQKNFISVIIPARNEENNIIKLLSDLEEQNYPKDKFEVIIINDHSEDHTKEYVENFMHRSVIDVHLHNLYEQAISPKKEAIEYGIKQSRGEIILTTDADVRIGQDWLKEMNQAFHSKHVMMVFGPVSYSGKGIFHHIQSLEFAALVGSGAASLRNKIPSMCNGANLAYRKKVFFEVNGFEENKIVPSGDDEFLMHNIFKKYPEGVQFLKNQKAIVETSSSKKLKSFIDQRMRWASKWKYYKSNKTKMLAILIFVLNFLWAGFLLVTVFNKINPVYFLIGLLVKFIVDFLFVNKVMQFLKKRFHYFSFLLLELLYPFYVLLISVFGSVGGYKWKGRRFRTHL